MAIQATQAISLCKPMWDGFFGESILKDEIRVPNGLDTIHFIPGKLYQVELVPVLKQVSSEDCIRFLVDQHAILSGRAGLDLVDKIRGNIFPVGMWTVSYAHKEDLHMDEETEIVYVPRVFICRNDTLKRRKPLNFDDGCLPPSCLLVIKS